MEKQTQHIAGVLSACTAAITGIACSTGNSAAADPALISTVTEYYYDAEKQDWNESSVKEYTYENAYPVNITTVNTDGERSSFSFEYTFDGDLPVSRSDYDSTGKLLQNVEYNNGRVWQITGDPNDQTTSALHMFSYANDDEYLTSVLHSTRYDIGTEQEIIMEEFDSIQVSTKNGLLAKTVNSGVYANWDAQTPKEWLRFNGTYTIMYESGIVKETSAIYRAGPSGISSVFEITVKDGKVAEAIDSRPDQDGNMQYFRKLVLTYTDTKIEKGRYTRMVNDIILDSTNGYMFNWY